MRIGALMILGGIAAVMFSGCGTGFREIQSNGSYWFKYDAEMRGAILLVRSDVNNAVSYCAEPAPDIAMERAGKLIADYGNDLINIGVEGSYATEALDLAKRSQTLMFLRESLYRLCELSINTDITTAQAVELYTKVLDSMKEFYKVEVSNADARNKEAEAEKSNAEARKKEAEVEKSKADAAFAEKIQKIQKETPGLVDDFLKSWKEKN